MQRMWNVNRDTSNNTGNWERHIHYPENNPATYPETRHQ